MFIITDITKEIGIGYKQVSPIYYSYDLKSSLIKEISKYISEIQYFINNELNIKINYSILNKKSQFKNLINALLFIYDNLIHYITMNINKNTKIYIDLYGIKIVEEKSEKSVKYDNTINKYVCKLIIPIIFVVETDYQKFISKYKYNDDDSVSFINNMINSFKNYFNIKIDKNIIDIYIEKITHKYDDNDKKHRLNILTHFAIKIYEPNFYNNKVNKSIIIKKSSENNILYKSVKHFNIRILDGQYKYIIENKKDFRKINNKYYLDNNFVIKIMEKEYTENFIKFLLSDSKCILLINTNTNDLIKKELLIEDYNYKIIDLYKDVFRKINKSFTMFNKYKYNKNEIEIIDSIYNFIDIINKLKHQFELLNILL